MCADLDRSSRGRSPVLQGHDLADARPAARRDAVLVALFRLNDRHRRCARFDPAVLAVTRNPLIVYSSNVMRCWVPRCFRAVGCVYWLRYLTLASRRSSVHRRKMLRCECGMSRWRVVRSSACAFATIAHRSAKSTRSRTMMIHEPAPVTSGRETSPASRLPLVSGHNAKP